MDVSGLFGAREKIRKHFKEKSKELGKVTKDFFLLSRMRGIVASLEEDALSEAEDGGFAAVDGVLAKYDKLIEKELADLKSKAELIK